MSSTTTLLPPRPTRDLVGKVAIVTGAGTTSPDDVGIGCATAQLLAEDGATVVCVDVDATLAERTAALINEAGRRREGGGGRWATAVGVGADVTSEADCAACVARTAEHGGGVDILVNGVGVLGPRGTAETVEPAAWAAGLATNVTSMMLMARHAVPAMRMRAGGGGGGGSIVNMGSVAGLQGGTPSLLYPTSKGAVVNMTRAMAAHHGADGVRVNCVCPGMVYTPMVYKTGMTPEMREARRNRSLLKTEGNAWDVAHAVRFLAGDEARWITGTVLTVDAGATCASFVPMNI